MLRSADPSTLARSRVVASNTSTNGANTKRRGKAKAKGNTPILKTVTVDTRLREFKNEPFRKSGGKLFCNACREELSTKASIIKSHVASSKHKSGITKLAQKDKQDTNILDAMKKYNELAHPKGETLTEEQRVYRVRVVTAGVPLNKLDNFCHLLEDGGYRLTSSTHTRQLIPFVLKEEEGGIKAEISGSKIAVIFHGTTRPGEALAIVVKFISNEWQIQQRLIRLELLAKSLKGEELARELISVLARQYNVQNDNLLGTGHYLSPGGEQSIFVATS